MSHRTDPKVWACLHQEGVQAGSKPPSQTPEVAGPVHGGKMLTHWMPIISADTDPLLH